jgi:DNA-binding MarR family transcriptional regulator
MDLIEQIRAFNRFYTSKLGILDAELFETGYSLTEGRIIYEIGAAQLIARDLTKIISVDEGYLSRIISKMVKQGIVERVPTQQDRRKMILKLSTKGLKIRDSLNKSSNEQLQKITKNLSASQRRDLAEAFQTIHNLLKK